jgi:gentisate 1,2-dioxygenase
MEQKNFQFIDRTGATYQAPKLNSAVLIKKQYLDEEIDRLASLPAPANGRRTSVVANPATGAGDGLANGISVSLNVLKPGERTRVLRDNSFLVSFCIRGGGYTEVDDTRISFTQYDTWTTPPWSAHSVGNDTDDLQVILTYSNAPLLEKLAVRVVEEGPKVQVEDEDDDDHASAKKGSPYGTFKLNETGAYLMPYEQLINPEHIEVKPLHWPWAKVKSELDRLRDLGKEYVGRRLYLLYDPATGRTNGTTFSFFAAITIRPANIVDRPHRHISAAINYFFAGSGYSSVGGKRYEWSAGDLMLSAPGWVVHNHASNNEDVYELTIQDQPMHLALGSLLWQEDLRHVPRLLGVGAGFATNRTGVGR